MRQLKGKPKENAREKKERKKEFAENREKVSFARSENIVGLGLIVTQKLSEIVI